MNEKRLKETVRRNIEAEYCMHDMSIDGFEADGESLIMRSQCGIKRVVPPYGQPDGYLMFNGVKWDYSYAYILHHAGNTGTFSGEKLWLREFIKHFDGAGFTIMDETFGYNQTKYSGYLSKDREVFECFIEIYHEGNMLFVTEE